MNVLPGTINIFYIARKLSGTQCPRVGYCHPPWQCPGMDQLLPCSGASVDQPGKQAGHSMGPHQPGHHQLRQKRHYPTQHSSGHSWNTVLSFGPCYTEKVWERAQRRAPEVTQGLRKLKCGERLRALGLSSLEKRRTSSPYSGVATEKMAIPLDRKDEG